MDAGQPVMERAPSDAADARRKRVLLTNAYGPYELKWGQAPMDLLGARLARGHKMFERSSHLPTWALYLIAENVHNPCTVLEFPRWDDFIKEVKKNYDVIAFQIKTIHTARIARMVRAVRELSPATEIVLGGYGVGPLYEGVPHDPERLGEYLLANANHVCRGEGVRFMREVLHDYPVDRPITQIHLPPSTVHPSERSSVEIPMPAILVSLGCPSACDFCNTSAFFHHKKIQVATPQVVYDTMKAHAKELGLDELTFILFDEDIFLDPPFVRELGRLIRSDRKTWAFRWISFGSVRALSLGNFTGRELRECGVQGIWIGVESGMVESEHAGYGKREASLTPPQLFADLRNHGIQTIGSMILGFDFHTKQNIEADIDYFLSLRPTFYQIGPMRPCPGTKLYRLMSKEQRINNNYTWNDFHLWEVGSHKVANFSDPELRAAYDLAHEKQRTVLGSPVLSIYECNLLAYQNLRDADTEFLRFHARLARDAVRTLFPVVTGIMRNAPSPEVERRAAHLLAQASVALDGDGMFAWAFRGIAGEVMTLLGRKAARDALREAERNLPETAWAPDVRLTRYNVPGKRAPLIDKLSSGDVQHGRKRRALRGFVQSFARV